MNILSKNFFGLVICCFLNLYTMQRDQTPQNLSDIMQNAMDMRFKDDIRAFMRENPEIITCGNDRGQTPLHKAAQLKDEGSILQEILTIKPNLEVRDFRHRTPLMHAALFGSLKNISLLKNQGANLTATDCNGKTTRQLLKDAIDAKKANLASWKQSNFCAMFCCLFLRQKRIEIKILQNKYNYLKFFDDQIKERADCKENFLKSVKAASDKASNPSNELLKPSAKQSKRRIVWPPKKQRNVTKKCMNFPFN
jgi:hypothetical protein